MPKIVRVGQKSFGNTASNNKIAVYGSLTAGSPQRYSGTTVDPVAIQALAAFSKGLEGSVVGSESPALEDQNALFYLAFRQLSYLLQTGVPEYDATTTYYIGSLVNDGTGVIYKSITDNNTGNALTSAANWIASSFGGLTVFTTSGTLTANSPTECLVNTPVSAVNITLPTTGVKKGRRFRVRLLGGTAANYVQFLASDSTIIDTCAGKGWIEVSALIDNPVTNTDWDIASVFESYTATFTWLVTGTGGGTTTAPVYITRRDNVVTLGISNFSSIAGPSSGSGSMITSTSLPGRIQPQTNDRQFWGNVINNGSSYSGLCQVLVYRNGSFLVTGSASATGQFAAAGGNLASRCDCTYII